MNFPYLLLSYVVRLSFLDPHGLEARFESYQRVCVLSPELHAITQRVWGKGDQIAEAVTSPAPLMQVTPDDGRLVLASKCEKPVRRGDELELYTTRRIHHGFKEEREGWEYIPFTPTERARIAIRFPIGREPDRMTVSSSNDARDPTVVRPGTKEVVLTVNSPVVGSRYRIDWSW